MWTTCIFIGLFFVIMGFISIKKTNKVHLVASIMVLGTFLIGLGWTQNYMQNSKTVSSQPSISPGEGAKILINDPDVFHALQKQLKSVTTKPITDNEYANIQAGDNIQDIYDKYGIGIPVTLATGGYGLVSIVDYPSVHKGEDKVVLIFSNNEVFAKMMKPLKWLPSDYNSNLVNMIDDSGVTYY